MSRSTASGPTWAASARNLASQSALGNGWRRWLRGIDDTDAVNRRPSTHSTVTGLCAMSGLAGGCGST